MSIRHASLEASPLAAPAWRRLAAAALRAASRGLDRLALRVARVAPKQALPEVDPLVVEFHAEAGAPEGALYVNGRLLGYLPGVNRL
ncbi:MAG: hypothetical protein KGI90_12080 [Burkholderiales bacterium]|nr:hypothetical protein [Burkholderiales bacterium]MDE2277325.1 hypothetical protein [Burkholderiales bacterium]